MKTEIKNTLPFFLENYFGPRGPVCVCFFFGAPRSVPIRFWKKKKKRVEGCLLIDPVLANLFVLELRLALTLIKSAGTRRRRHADVIAGISPEVRRTTADLAGITFFFRR